MYVHVWVKSRLQSGDMEAGQANSGALTSPSERYIRNMYVINTGAVIAQSL
jgi:hypothetical protein